MSEHHLIAALRGRAGMTVRCGDCGWTAEGGRGFWLVDRYVEDAPPGPRGRPESWLEFYWDDLGGPEDRLLECRRCGADLLESAEEWKGRDHD
jgi:hypothetical protein